MAGSHLPVVSFCPSPTTAATWGRQVNSLGCTDHLPPRPQVVCGRSALQYSGVQVRLQVVLYTWGEELHMMVDSWLGESVGQVLNWYSSKGYQLARISSSVAMNTIMEAAFLMGDIFWFASTWFPRRGVVSEISSSISSCKVSSVEGVVFKTCQK